MSIFTFDWTQIVYIGSPLITPWWAECNIAFGFFFFYWIVAPVVYFKNVSRIRLQLFLTVRFIG